MQERLLKCFFFNVLKGQAKIARGNAPGKRQHGDQALKGRASGALRRVISHAPTELDVRMAWCSRGVAPGYFRLPLQGKIVRNAG